MLAASLSGPTVAHAIDAREQAVADIEVLLRHNGHLVEAHTSKGEPLPVLTLTGPRLGQRRHRVVASN